MAGYGVDLSVPRSYDDLTRSLLRAAQRRGRSLGLRVRYRKVAACDLETTWLLAVDGRGWLISAWANQIERELPVVAEGYTGEGAGARAVEVAKGFIGRWIDWCVGDEAGGRPGRFFWPNLNLPDHAAEPRFRVCDQVVGGWMVGVVPHEVAIEEIHSGAELALRHVLRAGKSVSWARLIDRAVGAEEVSDEALASLRALNDERRVVKHRGGVIADGPEADVRAVIERAIEALDGLLWELDRR